ncbi:hypothetical protein N0M98_02400 [Paenibacillus doosanensis]|uniref:hypothetical protein n=1 Tax=Paenibacillus doosanensis TaxID=1229154 RepID=UPI00217FCE4F|nr:hypothetical protein [Paenibacillus doosanensis]MCS7458981.1 hypothetical protein [Paenibacillus doosanensis]
MTVIPLLSRLEMSRYSPFLIGRRQSNYLWIVLAILAALAGSMALMRDATTVSGLFTSGVLILFEAMLLLVLYDSASSGARYGVSRDWWLQLPHSRLSLLFGKALGLLRLGGHLAAYLLFIRVAHYALAAGWGRMETVPPAELLRILGADALLAAALMPVVVAFGLLLTVFHIGWARMAVTILCLYVSMPALIFTIMAGNRQFAADYLAPGDVARYAGIIAAAGWPLAGLCLWLAASVGMKRMSGIRYRSGAVSRAAESGPGLAAAKQGQLGGDIRRTPFRALVAMERRRHTSLLRTKAGKLIACILPAVAAIFAYRNGGNMQELISYQSAIVVLGYMAIVGYYINRHMEFQRNDSAWWLTFPHSRYLLLASRACAYLSVMLPYWGLLLLGCAAGALLKQWTEPMPPEQWVIVCRCAAGYLLLFVPLTVLYIIALQGLAAFVSRPWMSVLSMPLYAGYVLGFPLSQRVIAPERGIGRLYQEGPSPDLGTHLLLFYALVIPFAAWCFWLGGKHMHRYLLARDASASGTGRRSKQ